LTCTDVIFGTHNAMIDSLGDVKKVIRQADPDELQRLYEALNVEIVYNATGRMLDASIRPVGRDKASVRGGTWAPAGGKLAAFACSCGYG